MKIKKASAMSIEDFNTLRSAANNLYKLTQDNTRDDRDGKCRAEWMLSLIQLLLITENSKDTAALAPILAALQAEIDAFKATQDA